MFGRGKERQSGVILNNPIAAWVMDRVASPYREHIKVNGLEHLGAVRTFMQQRIPVMFVSNHLSNADFPAFYYGLKWSGFPDIASRVIPIYGIKLDKTWETRFLGKAFSIIPVWPISLETQNDKEESRKAQMNKEAYITTKRILRGEKHAIMLYPEGGRSYEGAMKEAIPQSYHYFTMVEGLVLVPVGIDGTTDVLAVGERRWTLGSPKITIGEPIDSNTIKRIDGQLSKDEYRKNVQTKVMLAIAKLLPEERQGVYKIGL